MELGTWWIDHRIKTLLGHGFVLKKKKKKKKTKVNRGGKTDRRKARLVAKGFTQRPGTDFHDTFAPVARASSIRMMMAMSAELDLTVH